jgi:hypothetical protein
MANGSSSVKWIIGLCLATSVAIVGWTVTGTLAVRMKSFDEVKTEVVGVKSNVSANNIRISVLENKYDTIQTSLSRIEALLMAHMKETK